MQRLNICKLFRFFMEKVGKERAAGCVASRRHRLAAFVEAGRKAYLCISEKRKSAALPLFSF